MRSRARALKATFAVLAATLLVGFVFVRAVQVQIGYQVPGEALESWVSSVIRFREVLYARLPPSEGKRIWIVTGSSGLFGIASDVIATTTGYGVRNYSVHAALSMETLFSQIKDKVKAGDIVVAPFEWELYQGPFGTEQEFTAFIDHLYPYVALPPDLAFRMFTAVPLRRWAVGLAKYITAPAGTKSYFDRNTDADLLAKWNTAQTAPIVFPIPPGQIYSHAALTAYGDINVETTLGRTFWVNGQVFGIYGITGSGLARVARWKSYFEGLGTRFVFVPPIMLDSKNKEVTSPATWERIESFASS